MKAEPGTPPGDGLAGLAALAFGHASAAPPAASATSRHLAFLSMEALELDLSDPEQRNFGDYELLEQLGAGGMGVVYRARQKSLDREVAVKLLSAGPWASADFIERFRREAQSAARLQHPNIVAIHEIGSRDELNYFSMTLVHGDNLAQYLSRSGALPPRQAARLVRTIAEALHYAHRLGVLHLDLKPGNVLIDQDGEPRVADFGLARRIDSTRATDATEVSGTPSYMAPEQIELRRHKLSVATDIYGLGAILYELITGQPPFEASSPEETLSLVLGGRLRNPRRYRPDLPRDLEAICLRCLAKEPGNRYPSAGALADDLGRFLEGRAVSVRPLSPAQRMYRWARREPRLAGAIGLGVLALVAGLGLALIQRERAEDSAAASREQTWRTRGDAAWRLVSEGRSIEALPLLLDNLREREAHGDAAGIALERLRLGTLERSGARLIDAIATGSVGRAIDLDADGRRVAVVDLDEQVRMYAVDDGRLLWQAATAEHTHFRAVRLPVSRLRFSADGRYLVTATLEPPTFLIPHGRNNVLLDAGSGAVVAPPAEVFPDFVDASYAADGSHALLRNQRGDTVFFRVDGWRALSPPRMAGLAGSWLIGDGGRFIAFSMQHRIALLDTRTLEPRFEHQFEAVAGPYHWAAQPGGDLLALGHADGTVRLLDSARPAMRELRPLPSDPIGALAFSDDGRWLLAGAGGRVFLWDVASGRGGPLPSARVIHPGRLQGDAAAGTVFAFAADDALLWQLPGPDDIDLGVRIAAARTPVTQFGFGRALPRNAAACAPAANLAASISRNGELRLWRWRDGRPLQAQASAQAVDELYFDGRHVAVADAGAVRVLDVGDERNAGPALQHRQPVSLATLAPDGDTVVTVSGRELRAFDWRTGTPRFAPIVMAGSPLRVAFSPDARRLLASIGGYHDGGYHELASTYDLHTGAALASDVPLPGPVAGLRFSADGRQLIHWRYGESQVRDTDTLAPRGAALRFGPDIAAARSTQNASARLLSDLEGETPVFDAAISSSGTRATLLVSGTEPTTPQLIEVDIASGRVLLSRSLPRGRFSRLWPDGSDYHFTVWKQSNDIGQWVHSADGSRPLPQAGGMTGFTQATSADGRWLASASSEGMLLADRLGGEWASAVLIDHLPPGDSVAQLGFARDGNALLARSRHGRWVWWSLAPDTRSVAQIQRHADHIGAYADPDAAPIATALPAQHRAELRAGDPGAPVAAASPPATAPAPPPPSIDRLGPGLATVDLRAAYNEPVDTDRLYEGALAPVPIGLQRMLGIDFDIAGMISLTMQDAPGAALGLPGTSRPVPPPRPRFDALHLLMGGCCPLPGTDRVPYAWLVLHYADGSRERIPVIHQRDVEFLDDDPGDRGSARIGWRIVHANGYVQTLYAPRLANPHPQRDVSAISFEASGHFASGPVILAATAEFADGGAIASATP